MTDKNSELKAGSVELDVGNKELDFEVIHSSLAHYNFPEGSMDHARNIMKATVHDIPRIRTWEEYRIHSQYEVPDAPSLFYQANGEIKQLLTLEHDPETVKLLNEKGLHIYLYEPLCLYIENDPIKGIWGGHHNFGFYSEWPNTKVPLQRARATELDSIAYYMGQNGLNHVYVHTGDYRVAEQMPYYNFMTLYCDDPFLNELMMYDNAERTIKRSFEKHFVCTNWRFTTPRAIMCAILSDIDSANLVWFFRTPVHRLGLHKSPLGDSLSEGTPWMCFQKDHPDRPKFYEQLVRGMDVLNERVPLTCDVKASSATEIDECAGHWYPEATTFDGMGNPVVMNPTMLPLEPLYRNAFVDVVNESRYGQPTGNISEKVLQSIQFKTPFLLVAPPYSLRYMKELGYKTFDRWWDESYDETENHLKRMEKLVDIVNWIASLSLEQCHDMYLDMLPVLKYNFEQMARNSRLGRITHLVKDDLLDGKLLTKAVEWAQSDGPSLAEMIEHSKNNREF